MSAENVALVRGIYEAFARGDIAAVVEALDPQVEWIEPYPVGHNPGTHIGPDAVVQNVFMPVVEEWHDFRVQPEEFFDAGDRVVVTGLITGRNRATSRDLAGPVCWVWTVRNGRATRNRNYQDTVQWFIAQSPAAADQSSPVAAATDPKIHTIQAIYEAFGRGDVAFILDNVTEDVDWASEPDSKVAPWHGIRRGRREVPSFFEALGATVEVTEFTPLAFTSNGSDVMTAIRFGLRVPATGKSGTMDIHHWWRFRDGKVCFYRGTEDTALTAALLDGAG